MVQSGGARAVLISRIIEQVAALQKFNFQAAFSKKEQRQEWESALSDVVMYVPLLKEVLPLFDKVSQWTQVLSSSSQVTISLVRPAIADIAVAILSLETKGTEYKVGGSGAKKILGAQMIKVAKSFDKYHKQYFNKDFSEFYIYRFAEFLDARTFLLMSGEGIEKVVDEMEVSLIYGRNMFTYSA